jgi:RimJ/RimL family protein N-acetyltransferase
MVIIDKEIAKWVMAKIGTPNDSMTAIGYLNSNNELIAGVAFENWNENNLFGHQRIDSPPSRQFWINVADYIFNQCGCKRFTATVEATNEKAIKLNLHIGFEIEATLKDAGRTGDLLVMTLWKDKCRFLNWVKHEKHIT